jgi:putative transposase
VRTITRSYRIRAYPNGAQRRLLDRWFGAVRWLWNTSFEIRSAAYCELNLTLTGNDLSHWLTVWKRTAGHQWLAEVPATCLTQCLRDQDRAFSNFFARRCRYPRYKGKRLSGSLRFQGVGAAWRERIMDAGDSCPEGELLKQVLAEEARSGHRSGVCLEQTPCR